MSSFTITSTGIILHTATGDVPVDIPNFSSLGIDPNAQTYHVYNEPQIVGSNDTHTTKYVSDANIIWENLKESPVPTISGFDTDTPVSNGSISNVPILGDVTTYIYDDNQIVVNVTQPDHLLSPGVVVRYLSEQPDSQLL